MVSEAKKRANERYDAENTVQVKMKLNKNTDADIIEWLAGISNRQGYLKELIRADMAKGGE